METSCCRATGVACVLIYPDQILSRADLLSKSLALMEIGCCQHFVFSGTRNLTGPREHIWLERKRRPPSPPVYFLKQYQSKGITGEEVQKSVNLDDLEERDAKQFSPKDLWAQLAPTVKR